MPRLGSAPLACSYVYPDSGQVQLSVPFDLYVYALDANGNVLTDYTGEIAFFSTDPEATLPKPYTFQRPDQGVAYFAEGVTLVTAGTQELYVFDTATYKGERLRVTVQSRTLVEYASVALAFLLLSRVVPLGPFEAMRLGDRADYWSPTAHLVLEVSGTETLAELGRRHREKVAQATANPYGWDAYVVVCAFSAQGHQIRFSAHC